jgi:hypothetical protein
MPPLIVHNGLQHKVRHFAGVVTRCFDLNRIEIECGITLRGTVTCVACLLKEVMWAMLGHVGEVVRNQLERLMLAALRDHIELVLVDTVHIHLLVVEPGRSDELARGEALSSLLAPAVIGSEVSVCIEPSRQRPRIE